MKTTIKITPYKRIVVSPNRVGHIHLELIHGLSGGVTTSELHVLTPDQAGVLMFAIEKAALAPWPQMKEAA